jgi:hypothetical protein
MVGQISIAVFSGAHDILNASQGQRLILCAFSKMFKFSTFRLVVVCKNITFLQDFKMVVQGVLKSQCTLNMDICKDQIYIPKWGAVKCRRCALALRIHVRRENSFKAHCCNTYANFSGG